MRKCLYKSPALEIICLEKTDLIRTSEDFFEEGTFDGYSPGWW